MSFPKKGRKFRPTSGKIFPNSHEGTAIRDGQDFAGIIAETLHHSFGDTHAAVKTVAAFTGAGERAVRNWFEGKNAPNGENLVELARHSDEVLEAFLLMAGRGDVLSAKKLVDARDKLIEMLGIIDQLLCGDATDNPEQD